MKLKPCPFCGSTEVDFDGTLVPVDSEEWTGDSWVICENCGCSSAICDSEEEAANVWNRRA